MIYGRKPVLEALRQGIVRAIFLDSGVHGSVIDRIRQEAAQSGVNLQQTAPKRDLDHTYQGVAAEIKPVRLREDLEEHAASLDLPENPLLLMLDGIEDPHNFGAILRSAYASGCQGVIIRTRRQAPLTDTVFKTSAGAAALIPVFGVNNLDTTLRALAKSGWWSAAANASESALDYRNFDWQRPLVLIVGAEGKGVSELLRKRADSEVYIPMPGAIDSLNVSVAAGILLFAAAGAARPEAS